MEKRTFRRIGFGLVAITASFQLLGMVLLGMADAFRIDPNVSNVAASSAFYLTGPLLLWLFVRRLPTCSQPVKRRFLWWEVLGLFGLCQAVTLPLNLLGMSLNALVSLLLGSDGGAALIVSDILTNTPFLASLLFMGILSPFFEELVFRGILLRPLRPFGDKVAILVSGITFGLFHANFTQFFYAAVLGMVFAYVTVKSGSIRTAVVLHMMINTFSVVYSYLSVSAETAFEMLPSLLMLGLQFLAMVGGVVFAVLRRKQFFLSPAPYSFSTKVNGRLIFGNIGMLLFILVSLALALLTAATY